MSSILESGLISETCYYCEADILFYAKPEAAGQIYRRTYAAHLQENTYAKVWFPLKSLFGMGVLL